MGEGNLGPPSPLRKLHKSVLDKYSTWKTPDLKELNLLQLNAENMLILVKVLTASCMSLDMKDTGSPFPFHELSSGASVTPMSINLASLVTH